MSSQCVQVQVQFVPLRLPVIGEDTQWCLASAQKVLFSSSGPFRGDFWIWLNCKEECSDLSLPPGVCCVSPNTSDCIQCFVVSHQTSVRLQFLFLILE